MAEEGARLIQEECVTPVEMKRLVRAAVDAAESKAAFARRAGCGPSQVADFMSGRRAPTPGMIAAAGFMRVDRYVRIGKR